MTENRAKWSEITGCDVAEYMFTGLAGGQHATNVQKMKTEVHWGEGVRLPDM